VPLPGGKTLHLGPGKTGQISDQAADGKAVQRLIEQGTIELLGESDRGAGEGSGSSAAQPHESTHGHSRPTGVSRRGDR
jgi:hypothetical protein